MDSREVVPLVQFINRYDDRYRAEAHFLQGGEAMVMLLDSATRRPLPPILRVDDYVRDARSCSHQSEAFAQAFQEWLIAQGRPLA
jgi:hypothetical protein